jgi:methylase of polypeptide subunit release factors
MVMPMHPENAVLIEAIPACPGARLLDIGFGSGIFMLVGLQRGAQSAVGVEVSRRARDFALFNLLLNEFSPARCDLRINASTSPERIFEPVSGQRFDLIVCNPPFEVWSGPGSGSDTKAPPPHLANAGVDGLDYFRVILPGILEHLNPADEPKNGSCGVENGASAQNRFGF